MSDSPDPLSPDIAAFLEPERRRPDPPALVRADVLARLGATLGLAGGPGGSDGGASPAGGHAGGAVAAGEATKQLVTRSLKRTLTTLLVGGVIGAGVHEAYDRAYDRAADRRAEQARVAATAAPPPASTAPLVVVPEAPSPPASVVRVESPPARPERPARVEVRERDRSLAAERGLIEQARSALARNNGAAALAALDRHAKEFPRGEMEEERESLEVQALVGLERFDQARKLGARFLRRYPHSIFGAVVDEALKSIP